MWYIAMMELLIQNFLESNLKFGLSRQYMMHRLHSKKQITKEEKKQVPLNLDSSFMNMGHYGG